MMPPSKLNMQVENPIQGKEKRDDEVATEAFEACKSRISTARKETWKNCITLRPYTFITLYKEEIRTKVPDAVRSGDIRQGNKHFPNILDYTTILLDRSKCARRALREMVDICISIFDIACYCKVGLFTMMKTQSYGVTKWLQFLTSECRDVQISVACCNSTSTTYVMIFEAIAFAFVHSDWTSVADSNTASIREEPCSISSFILLTILSLLVW